ncbi:MAG TPA: alpha/beta fold hydrolase [Candidatus Obscuribacterales bacterium]
MADSADAQTTVIFVLHYLKEKLSIYAACTAVGFCACAFASLAQSALPESKLYVAAPKFDTAFASWPVEGGKPEAAVLSIHGFGLHKGAFDSFAKRLARAGIVTYAIDVRGFGSWTDTVGPRGEVNFYQTLMDVRTALYWVKTMHPGVPMFLLGESMGGAIALQATALFPDSVNGLIASVPGDDFYGENKARFKVALGMMLPNARMDMSGQVIERATSKDSVQNSWKQDPQSRLKFSAREITAFNAFMKKSHELARSITEKPVLMFQGGLDRLSKPDGTVKLFRELPTADKDLVVLGDSEHLIFEKGQFDEHVIEVVSSWIHKHSRKASQANTAMPR